MSRQPGMRSILVAVWSGICAGREVRSGAGFGGVIAVGPDLACPETKKTGLVRGDAGVCPLTAEEEDLRGGSWPEGVVGEPLISGDRLFLLPSTAFGAATSFAHSSILFLVRDAGVRESAIGFCGKAGVGFMGAFRIASFPG